MLNYTWIWLIFVLQLTGSRVEEVLKILFLRNGLHTEQSANISIFLFRTKRQKKRNVILVCGIHNRYIWDLYSHHTLHAALMWEAFKSMTFAKGFGSIMG